MKSSIISIITEIFRNIWKKLQGKPGVKYISIDIAVEQAYIDELEIDNGSDSLNPSLGMPVVAGISFFSLQAIAPVPRGIHGKAAFIQVNNDALVDELVPQQLLLKAKSLRYR